jgi:hypothetical protein
MWSGCLTLFKKRKQHHFSCVFGSSKHRPRSVVLRLYQESSPQVCLFRIFAYSSRFGNVVGWLRGSSRTGLRPIMSEGTYLVDPQSGAAPRGSLPQMAHPVGISRSTNLRWFSAEYLPTVATRLATASLLLLTRKQSRTPFAPAWPLAETSLTYTGTHNVGCTARPFPLTTPRAKTPLLFPTTLISPPPLLY